MMTLDHGGGSLPPAVEAGVLFGFGRAGPPIGSEFAKAWKYQAPHSPAKLAHERKLEQNKSSGGQHWIPTWSDGLFWETDPEPQPELVEPEPHPLEYQIHPDQSLEPETHSTEDLLLSEQPVQDDHVSSEDLLGSLADGEEVAEPWLESAFRVLSSTVEEPGGQHLASVIHALHCRAVPVDFWKKLAFILRSKSNRRTITHDEAVNIFKLLLERAEDWESPSFIFASQIGRTTLSSTLLDTLEFIVNSPQHKAKTSTWLKCLRLYNRGVREGNSKSFAWNKLYALLARSFRPSDPCVVHHFGELKRTDFAQVLLYFYVPIWLGAADKYRPVQPAYVSVEEFGERNAAVVESGYEHSSGPAREAELGREDGELMDYGSYKGIYVPFSTAQPASESEVTDLWSQDASALNLAQRLRRAELQLRGLLKRGTDPSCAEALDLETYAIVHLVQLLQQCNLPPAQLLDEAFEVYMQTGNTNTTKNLFFGIRSQKRCAIPTTVAGKLVSYFIASDDVDYAYYVFSNVPTLPLLPYAELLLKLIEHGRTHGARIFEMLNRYHSEDRLPSEQRQDRRLSIKPEHVDLVHECAYAFASSGHLSPRTAFRRVWECFRWLRDRNAPLQPLISRALVKAGISRALKERERLTREQVKYVISIVDLIEGSEVAKEVDRIVWETWNWSLERQWSRGLPPAAKGPDGQGRSFDKPRRLWTKEGGRIFVPFPDSVDSKENQDLVDSKEAQYKPFAEAINDEDAQHADSQNEMESSAEEIDDSLQNLRMVKDWTSVAEMEEFVSEVYGPAVEAASGTHINDAASLTKIPSPLLYHTTGRHDDQFWSRKSQRIATKISSALQLAYRSLHLDGERLQTIGKTHLEDFEDAWPSLTEMQEVLVTLPSDLSCYNAMKLSDREARKRPYSGLREQHLHPDELSLIKHLQRREKSSKIKRVEFRKVAPAIVQPKVSPFASAVEAYEAALKPAPPIRIVEVPETLAPEIPHVEGAVGEPIEPVSFTREYVREAKDKVYWRFQ